MMRRFLVGAILTLAAAAVPAAIVGQSSADTLFREALMMERAEGRLREAVFRYERVVAEFPSDRQVVAQALHQLALAYERLDDPRAALMWSRLAAAAPNPFAAEARRRVEAAQQAEPRSPFPVVPLDPAYGLGAPSPDGRWVALRHDTQPDRLYLRNVSDGTERLLLDLDGPALSNFVWSPDNRRIAFSRMVDPPRRDVGIVTVQDATVRYLSGEFSYPSLWTLADELLVFRTNYPESATDYWLIPAAGGEARLVHSEPFGAALCGVSMTPDGRSLVLCRSERLVVRDLNSGAERPVTNGTGKQRGARVSHDGRLLAFQSNEDGTWALYVAPLDRIPVNEPVRLATTDEALTDVTWIGDRQLTLRTEQGESHLYRVDVDPRTGRAIDAPRRLTQDTRFNGEPAVSPDNARIAYFSNVGNSVGLSVMDANGLNERPLLQQGGVLPVAWRSASEILFRDLNAASPTAAAIAALDVNTGNVAEVARTDGLYWWYVPARREILHLQRGSPLKALSLADGRNRDVATLNMVSARLRVSPDGRRFATTVVAAGRENGCDLILASLEGSVEGTLLSGQAETCPFPLAWSPDGRFLLVGARSQPQLRVMNVETRDIWPLHPDMANQEGWFGAWSQTWSPDGSFIVLTRGVSEGSKRTTWNGVTYQAVTRLIRR